MPYDVKHQEIKRLYPDRRKTCLFLKMSRMQKKKKSYEDETSETSPEEQNRDTELDEATRWLLTGRCSGAAAPRADSER